MTAASALRDERKKIRLENRFKPKLRTFFRNIADEVQATLGASRRIPDLSFHNRDMAALLREQYRLVTRSFRGESSEELTKSIDHIVQETKQIDEEIDARLIQENNARSERQAAFIMQTTQKQLNQSLQNVAMRAATDNVQLTNEEAARQVRREFIAQNSNRVDTIAMTETQAVAENTKFQEAAIVSTAVGLLTVKTWNTILDNFTRPSHVQADQQKRRLGEPFLVQGQLLNRPGDTSLGATVDNVVNCRCSASFSIADVRIGTVTAPSSTRIGRRIAPIREP